MFSVIVILYCAMIKNKHKRLTDDQLTGRWLRGGTDDECNRDRGEHMPGTREHDDSAGLHPQRNSRELTATMYNGRVSRLAARRVHVARAPTRVVAPPEVFAAKRVGRRRHTAPPPIIIINPFAITPHRPRRHNQVVVVTSAILGRHFTAAPK